MKTFKNIFLASLFIICILFTSCDKNDNELSKATYLPEINLVGDEMIFIELGDSYTEQGAVATIEGESVEYNTISDVDDTESGIYTITYSVKNEDGFAVSTSRTVIVYNIDVLNEDLSGTYQRDGNTPASVWVRDVDQPYKYLVNNPGGVGANPPFDVSFYVYSVDVGTVVVPLQQSGQLAPFYCTTPDGNKKIPFNTSAAVGEVAYAWLVNGANFSATTRTFKKVM